MASPIALGVFAALCLSSTAALACEGSGCWGMAPAQEKNPGYTGPNYAAMYGPPGGYGAPGGYDQGYGGAAGPSGQPGYDQGYDQGYGQGYGMDAGNAGSGRPYAGPVEGYPLEDYQNADGSSPNAYDVEPYGAPPAQYAQGYGAPPPQDGQGYGAPPMDDRYGPPPTDQGYGPEPYGDEQGPPPEDDGGPAPEAYGPPDRGGYDQGAYGPPDQYGQGGDDQGGYAEAGPPAMDDGAYGYDQGPAHGGMAYGGTEPYEGRWARGSESYRDSGYRHGYRHRSYRSFDKSKYVYDSGWQVQYGPSEVYDFGTGWGGDVVGRF